MSCFLKTGLYLSKKLQRCAALDTDGVRCTGWADTVYQYHGDNEMYEYGQPEPKWVVVPLCEDHAGSASKDNQAAARRDRKRRREAMREAEKRIAERSAGALG